MNWNDVFMIVVILLAVTFCALLVMLGATMARTIRDEGRARIEREQERKNRTVNQVFGEDPKGGHNPPGGHTGTR